VQAAVTAVGKAVPTVEAVATAIDPAAAAAITALGNASDVVLARVSVALADQATLQASLASGTVTIPMATQEIADVKSLQPAILSAVQALGLGHTIPVAAAAPAVAAAPAAPAAPAAK
jgi:hypothetical protein